MADDDSRKVALKFSKQNVTLQASGAETGHSKVELPIDFAGKGTQIAFDPKLLTDMLNVLPTDATIALEMTDDKTPATFRCGEKEVRRTGALPWFFREDGADVGRGAQSQ